MRNALRVHVVGALALTAVFFGVALDSPVADAARNGDLERVRALLVEGADVNAAQGDGMTALHWAALGGRDQMAAILLYAGASTDAITRLGAYTALHLASRNGHAGAVSILLEGGADATATATTGATPLHFAATAGSAAAIAALVEAGADIDAP
ncbi:MAG: ankyrin repeat domain-containing protein, partial [Gemmatimonadota bacterium]